MKYDNDYTLWLPNLVMVLMAIMVVAFMIWGLIYAVTHPAYEVNMICVRGHDEYFENQGVKFLCDQYEQK